MEPETKTKLYITKVCNVEKIFYSVNKNNSSLVNCCDSSGEEMLTLSLAKLKIFGDRSFSASQYSPISINGYSRTKGSVRDLTP